MFKRQAFHYVLTAVGLTVAGCGRAPQPMVPDPQLFAKIHDAIELENPALGLNSQGASAHITGLDGQGFLYSTKARFGPKQEESADQAKAVWAAFDHYSLVHDGWQYGLFVFLKSPIDYKVSDAKRPAHQSGGKLLLFSFASEERALRFRDLLTMAANRHGAHVQNELVSMKDSKRS